MKRRRGRPRIGERVDVRVDPAVIDTLSRHAVRRGVSLAAVLRRALAAAAAAILSAEKDAGPDSRAC